MKEETSLELVLELAERLCRVAPFEAGAADLCGRLALIGGARGLALFALQGDELQAALLGAYALPIDYPRRFPPRERRPVSHLPGDLRDALRCGAPVLVEGIDVDPRTASLASVAMQGHYTSTLSIPLLLEERPVGLLHAFFVPDADVARRELLARVAPLLASALALDAWRLHADRQRETPSGALLYPVTQTYRQLGHVHAAAERYGLGYSVAVYAIDHAEAVASRYGRELLEQAVAGLGELLAAECRDADHAGRLSASECLMVMPGTVDRGAFAQAERVLQRFARTVFRVGDDRLTFSASAGISAFPVNGALDGRSSVVAARAALAVARSSEGERTIAIAATGAAVPTDD